MFIDEGGSRAGGGTFRGEGQNHQYEHVRPQGGEVEEGKGGTLGSGITYRKAVITED